MFIFFEAMLNFFGIGLLLLLLRKMKGASPWITIARFVVVLAVILWVVMIIVNTPGSGLITIGLLVIVGLLKKDDAPWIKAAKVVSGLLLMLCGWGIGE